MKDDATYQYGAEHIAARYNASVVWSVGVALALVLAAVAYPYVADALRKSKDEKMPVKMTRVINYSELQAPPPIDLERSHVQPIESAPKAKTVRFLPPVVKKDEEVPDDELMPTRDQLGEALIGIADIEGTDSVYMEQADTQVLSEPVAETKPNEVFTFVEIMPEFPGGKDEFMKWLSANTNYPAIARESNIQGTVFVSFIIAKDGSITEVEVVRSVHPQLDDEAMRVISAMPRWTPGKQNQEAVSVKFTLPVGFKIRK
jgi:protein TonB